MEEQRIFSSDVTHPKDVVLRYCDVIKYPIDLETISNKKIILNLSQIQYGIKEIFWSVGFNNVGLVWDYSIDECVLKILNPDGNDRHENKYIEIHQDMLQMMCSNNAFGTKSKFPFYTFGFSLEPLNYHSTGDFYVNNFDVKLEIIFNEKINIYKKLIEEKNKNIQIIFFINQMKIMRYYKDDEGNLKCKFISISEALEQEN